MLIYQVLYMDYEKLLPLAKGRCPKGGGVW